MGGRVSVRKSHFLKVKVEIVEIKVAEERLAKLECGLYKVDFGYNLLNDFKEHNR